MKRIFLTIIIGFITLISYSQVIADKQLNNFVQYLKTKNVSDEEINMIVSGLIENPDLRRELSKNAIEIAKTKFSWKQITEKYLKLYKSE